MIDHSDIQVGVRPEHVSLVEKNGPDAGLEVVVNECDYQGSETILTTHYQGSTIRACLPGVTQLSFL